MHALIMAILKRRFSHPILHERCIVRCNLDTYVHYNKFPSLDGAKNAKCFAMPRDFQGMQEILIK